MKFFFVFLLFIFSINTIEQDYFSICKPIEIIFRNKELRCFKGNACKYKHLQPKIITLNIIGQRGVHPKLDIKDTFFKDAYNSSVVELTHVSIRNGFMECHFTKWTKSYLYFLDYKLDFLPNINQTEFREEQKVRIHIVLSIISVIVIIVTIFIKMIP